MPGNFNVDPRSGVPLYTQLIDQVKRSIAVGALAPGERLPTVKQLAVDLTMAAINRVNIQGTTEQQTEQLRSVMAVVFPEAVTLVREAREGLQ